MLRAAAAGGVISLGDSGHCCHSAARPLERTDLGEEG